MPSSGSSLSGGGATLIVGNPRARPRCSPFTMVPVAEYGRPRSCCAVARSPWRRAWRMRVELTAAPPSEIGSTTVTANL